MSRKFRSRITSSNSRFPTLTTGRHGVLQALGRLPFNQRAALVMRELEGRSYAEIADTIGVSVSAVETLIFRARRSLRLKASSLRSLVAVPLPTSLTQFFEGGGVVTVGGGAAVGTGVVLKAAVAIVAAALGTSIGGDNTRPATAAPRPTSGSVARNGEQGWCAGVEGPADGAARCSRWSRRGEQELAGKHRDRERRGLCLRWRCCRTASGGSGRPAGLQHSAAHE